MNELRYEQVDELTTRHERPPYVCAPNRRLQAPGVPWEGDYHTPDTVWSPPHGSAEREESTYTTRRLWEEVLAGGGAQTRAGTSHPLLSLVPPPSFSRQRGCG